MADTPSQLIAGLNMDSSVNSLKEGIYTFAINANIENFDGNQLSIQNDQANEFTLSYPEGYKVNGVHTIQERNLDLVWLLNDSTGDSEIGYIQNDSYTPLINSLCINLSREHPILKAVHRGSQIYWTDAYNKRRFIDLDNLPITNGQIDCNKLLVQPNFSVPQIYVEKSSNDGDLISGTYEFGFRYSNSISQPYTSIYSITNPASIADITKIIEDFNYPTNKSLSIEISNIDNTGYYDYFDLIVIKTINNEPTVELVGNYKINGTTEKILYTGQNKQSVQLTIDDVFEKYPVYNVANDVTTAQDVLIWTSLTKNERVNYQQIANKITLNWQTWRIKSDNAYKRPEITALLKGHMRDETYPYELVPILKNGAQADGFHIPGRVTKPSDLTPISNFDSIQASEFNCTPEIGAQPTWKVYNTASVIGYEQVYTDFIAGKAQSNCSNCPIEYDLSSPECYVGPYQYGEFAYIESTELYPNDEQWEDLAGTPIRHHKFPDSLVTHIHDNEGFIYPIGVRIDTQQVYDLIQQSTLTQEEKDNIQGFKIVRGNRATNKSVVAKGLISNVLKYTTKDKVISADQGLTESDPILNLLNTTIDITDQAKDSLGPLRFESTSDMKDALEYLNQAKSLVTTSQEFRNKINQSRAKVQDVRNKSGLDAKSEGLLDASLQLHDTLLDISLAVSEIPASVVDSSESENILYFPNYLYNDVSQKDPLLDNIIVDDSSKQRYTFHSPDTSFYQPNLGNILKLETIENGYATSHITEVKNHSKYQFVNNNAYIFSLISGLVVGFASGTYGVSVNAFNGTAAFTAYQAMIDIIFKITPHKNFAYQLNSIGQYSSFIPVGNDGNKQRFTDIAAYLAPGMFNIGDDYQVNNYQRESSVYLKTNNTLPYVHDLQPSKDLSKILIPTTDSYNTPISSFYASIKNNIPNQYGQLYSYETIDTGFQWMFQNTNPILSIFGGDIFINKFSYKSKLPLFLDNRVSTNEKTFPDDADISYNELSNIGKVKYWFSTDVNEKSGSFGSIFGVKAHNFYLTEYKFFNDFGKIFLFAYGIPTFFVESEVNVDLRQAFNSKEGDFYPHVSSGIPDDWLQETNVSINYDNTYHYNKTFSKQNKENNFSHIPNGYLDRTYFPYLSVFSDIQQDNSDLLQRNNWLIYKPSSSFTFPNNYGAITSLDGIENRQVLVRFENKSLLYNALLTIPTSTAQAYLGQSLFSSTTPPLDYAETDLGYAGSQHKLFLKTEGGSLSIDCKRGKIFLYQGQNAKDITQGISYFLKQNLPFQILKQFPSINIDNHFNGLGLHGVYDSLYERIIITKLDYAPLNPNITYSGGAFFLEDKEIELTDINYFCNKSFTLSYSLKTQSWISFHTFFPNYYIGKNNFFYSGTSSLWKHNTSFTTFNKYYDQIEPYIIEYPFSYKGQDEIVQSIKDYSKIYSYTNENEFTETDDIYFNSLILYSNQQCSGILNLVPKPKHSLSEYTKYPIYNLDSKTIIYTKSDSYYNINTFWSLVKTSKNPIWIPSCENLSIQKELNQENMSYGKKSYSKAPIRSRELKCRFTLDNTDQYKIISQFLINRSMPSKK